MKFVMYGAGSIGRGFIGPLFASAGYEVSFIDIDEEIISALNKKGEYTYTVAAQPPYDLPVTGVRGVDGRDPEAVIQAIAECDLMAASLGGAVLQRVAPLIARGLQRRWERSGRPLDILICENLKDSSHLLESWLSEALPEPQREKLSVGCGLIEAAIGRMVPIAVRNEADPLHLTVEEYGFLPVDQDAFRGPLPQVPGLVPHSPFAFYEERKLYLHNMGHAICAYLGGMQGHEYIWQAVGDPLVRIAVQSAMTEAAAMLSQRYNVPFWEIYGNACDLLQRFSNRALGDTCERVGRDPMRKLASGDRLAGALRLCDRYNIHAAYTMLGLAAALRHQTEDAAQARRIAEGHSGLTPEQAALVMGLYGALSGGTLQQALNHAEALQKTLRGAIV